MKTGMKTVWRAGVCLVWMGCLATGPALAQTEPAYVTDKLQLGVHMLPDTSDKPFAKLKSGDRVQVIETGKRLKRNQTRRLKTYSFIFGLIFLLMVD